MTKIVAPWVALCIALATPSLASAKDIGITAFKDICYSTAPDFSGAEEKAKKYVSKISKLSVLGINGMSADGTLGVQIKPGKECVVTTPDQPEPQKLTAEFQKAVLGKAQRANPVSAKVSGHNFVFMHDTTGGEAYIMTRN